MNDLVMVTGHRDRRLHIFLVLKPGMENNILKVHSEVFIAFIEKAQYFF